MVEGVTIGSGGHSGSSSSSHSSSSSSSSKNRDTRILIRVSPLVQPERIHSFFDRSLSLAKPPIGCGFVKKVHRKSDDKVILSIEDASIARRLVSSFSDSRSKIDGHEFTIELYTSDHSKSLSSPSNGDKKKEKESIRMSSCPSESSPSSSTKREYHSSSRPSTSTNDSMRNECLPSSSSSIPIDPYEGIVAVAMHKLPFMCESIIKEILSAGLREIGGYLDHFTDDSGRMKVLLKRTILLDETPSEERITVQGEEVAYTTLPSDETRKLYDRYLASTKSHSSLPSTSSSSSSSYPSRCPSNRDAFSYESSRTIFLPCLTKGTTKDFIRKRFHKIGEVLKAEVKNANSVSPHAIVEFAHSQSAVMAMEDYEKEQKDEGGKNPLRNRKRPHFIPSSPSLRVWVANLPSYEEDYVKKKLMELIKGAQNATVVVDTRRREGIIDFASQDIAKQFLEVLKSSPIMQQNGQVQTWLVADFCSEDLYTHFRDRRGVCPNIKEVEIVSILSKRIMSDSHREEAASRMEKIRGGDEKPAEKKSSINGENGNHAHSPSSSRRSNAEDRRSGDSGFSEDRDKLLALDSDDDEVLEAKWTKAAIPIDRSGENGKLRERLMKMGDAMEEFYKILPQKEKKVKKEVDEEGRENSEKMKRDDKINFFRDALLNVSTPLKARPIEEMGGYRGNPLRSPPIPISPLNGDRRHTVRSPPSGIRPAPLHINIPPSTSTAHSNTNHSPYTRLPSSSSSRHPSISTPSTLTPRSQTMPSTNNRPFPIESNGDHGWNNGIGGGIGSNAGTPTSSRVPLSRRESVCSNSSQSHTPLPPIPSTSNTGYTPAPLKSPPVTSWSANAWKPSSLSSPNPSSINRSRPSIDSHHKPSTPLISRPGLPKMDKPGYSHGSSSSLPKTPSLPRSSSMNEKKPNISRESSKDIVNNFIQNKNGPDVKKMPRIPKKENRERDEKDDRREKKREEKDRERREERKEKKEDRKKSRENESKEEKAKRKELKRKEREKEERKKSMNEKEKKRKNMESEKKKKKKQSRTLSESADSDFDSDDSIFKVGSSSKQMADDEALARSLAGSSMYDRVKVRRSGSNREEKKKIDALEAIRKKKKKEMKTKKRAHLSSSSESEGEIKESGKKMKKEEDEESSDEEEEKERRMKEKKKEKKREKERRETSDESDTDDERENKRKKKEKKVSKKNSLLDLFSDDADSVKSEKKEKLSKKRSHEKDDSPSTSHPPPEKKVKKEETSSSASESEGERSSKKSEVSISSRTRDDKIRRLSESSVATEKDESWKSPASGSVEKEIKEEPKEDRPAPRLMTKAAMKEFGGGPSSSPAQFNKDETGRSLVLSSEDSSQSSSDSDDEEKEREERKDDEENREEDRNDEVKIEEENEEIEEKNEEEKEEEEEEAEVIEEKKEDEIMEEMKEEEDDMRMEMDENHSIERDDEAESAVRGLESPTDQVIEETEKAVESIFDEEEEPEARYPSNDFLNPSDMNLSSSSSQCSSPKIPLTSSLLHRPTPIHPHSIASPSILSPSPIHSHIIQSHSIPPSISSPLISPSGSRPSSIHQYQVRPISQESSSQHLHDDNGGIIHQEKTWTSHGSSSDGFSPSPNHHPTMNKEEIIRKFPTQWQGKLKMKQKYMTTTWFKLLGDEGLLTTFFNSAVASIELNGENADVIEVSKKMRLDNEKIRELNASMENGEDHACLIATPAGATQEQVLESSGIFRQHFVRIFRQKEIAGITEFTAPDGHQYVGQYFAPGQFVTDYLSPKYPDFLDLLSKRYSDAFLLVLLKRKEE